MSRVVRYVEEIKYIRPAQIPSQNKNVTAIIIAWNDDKQDRFNCEKTMATELQEVVGSMVKKFNINKVNHVSSSKKNEKSLKNVIE